MSSPRGDNPFDKYRSQLNQIRDLALQERNVTEIWRHTCQWYQDDGGRELFVEALKYETGIQVNLNTDPHQRIGAALPKTWSEYETKPRNDAYFRAVAELFLEEMDSIVSKVPRDCRDPKATLLYGNVIRFVKHVLGDSYLLFEEWGTFRADTPGVFGIRKSLFSHPVEFFHGARQIIYGHGTFGLSFADNHSELAVASIRQAVEIRLRQALGVIGKESLKDHTISPDTVECALGSFIDSYSTSKCSCSPRTSSSHQSLGEFPHAFGDAPLFMDSSEGIGLFRSLSARRWCDWRLFNSE